MRGSGKMRSETVYPSDFPPKRRSASGNEVLWGKLSHVVTQSASSEVAADFARKQQLRMSGRWRQPLQEDRNG